MLIDDIAPQTDAAIRAAEDGTNATLPMDAGTVPTKPCCGVLLGDECDCRAFAAEARGVFARGAIMCRPASQWTRA